MDWSRWFFFGTARYAVSCSRRSSLRTRGGRKIKPNNTDNGIVSDVRYRLEADKTNTNGYFHVGYRNNYRTTPARDTRWEQLRGLLCYPRYDINRTRVKVASIYHIPPGWCGETRSSGVTSARGHRGSLELHQNPFNSAAAEIVYFILLRWGTDVVRTTGGGSFNARVTSGARYRWRFWACCSPFLLPLLPIPSPSLPFPLPSPSPPPTTTPLLLLRLLLPFLRNPFFQLHTREKNLKTQPFPLRRFGQVW